MKKLEKVTIGTNVSKIGKNAFSGDSKLKSIQIKSKKLTSVGKGALKKHLCKSSHQSAEEQKESIQIPAEGQRPEKERKDQIV